MVGAGSGEEASFSHYGHPDALGEGVSKGAK